MKRTVINYLIIAAHSVSAACKSNDPVGGKGLLKINGKEFSIISASICFKEIEGGTKPIRFISFFNVYDQLLLSLIMNTKDEKLKAKTYTASEIEILRISTHIVDGTTGGSYDYIDENAVMKVDMKGKTYNITVTGLAIKDKYETEYTMTYEGGIEVIDCN